MLLSLQAFKDGPDANQVFFVELVYERSKDVFQRLGVTQLPYIFNWGPEASAKEGRGIKLSKSAEVGSSVEGNCSALSSLPSMGFSSAVQLYLTFLLC